MAKLRILGSCSGTEPMPERHHTSLVLTVNDRNYFFDAGENCSYSAHLADVALLKTRAIFISHCHYDHIGGLMGLIWTIRKLMVRTKQPLADESVRLFIPALDVWDSVFCALCPSEKFRKEFVILADTPKPGRLYQDENLTVFAFESHHMSPNEEGAIRSFSYRIEIGRRSFVFSGDVKNMDDLEEPVRRGCDFLFCETGHHKVSDVCEFSEKHNVKKLILIHHGREILEDRPTVQAALSECKIPVELAFDSMTVEV